MKYRTQSANVLNEADRFQRILDWELFTMEQDARIWGYNPDVKWTPGDPLFKHPALLFIDGCDCCGTELPAVEDAEDGYVGNTVRPMFELIGEFYPNVNCEACAVSWWAIEQKEECWNCGEVVSCAFYKNMGKFYREFEALQIRVPDFEFIGARETMEGLFVEMRAASARAANVFQILQESLLHHLSIGFGSADLPSYSFQGAEFNVSVVDEALSAYRPPSTGYLANSLRTLFEQPEVVGPLWGTAALYDPTLGMSYWNPVRLPANWAELGARPIPLPEMPEPRAFASKGEPRTFNTPVTERRPPRASKVIPRGQRR